MMEGDSPIGWPSRGSSELPLMAEMALNGISRDDPGARPPYLPIYRTDLSGSEQTYLLKCLENNQLSAGDFVRAFEDSFSEATGSKHAISVTSGTTALHLALHALNIGPGDEVIVPSFTFIATANAVAHTGARPVFVDCDEETWLMTAETIRPKISTRTKAIVATHLYRGVCDMADLRALAQSQKLELIEDCAQAIGASFRGRSVGRWGIAGTFSFFGNKTITTGEGGIITTDDDMFAERLRSLRNHAPDPRRRYWHLEQGFNYKMTDLAAAVGVAQMERLPQFLLRKREIARRYEDRLSTCDVALQRCDREVESGEWLFSLVLPENMDRAQLIATMHARGIEIRPVFQCIHIMPAYRRMESLPTAERIARRGISLPSYPSLSDRDVDRVLDELARASGAMLQLSGGACL